MLFSVPCCMYPIDEYIYKVNFINVMCGEFVDFPFQNSCSKHFQYLAFNMSNDLITINKLNLNNKTSHLIEKLYTKLYQTFPVWNPVKSFPIIDSNESIFFDNIQKIWFNPKTGLGYEGSSICYYRYDHVFHQFSNCIIKSLPKNFTYKPSI